MVGCRQKVTTCHLTLSGDGLCTDLDCPAEAVSGRCAQLVRANFCWKELLRSEPLPTFLCLRAAASMDQVVQHAGQVCCEVNHTRSLLPHGGRIDRQFSVFESLWDL